MTTHRIISEFRVDCVTELHGMLNSAVEEAHAQASAGGSLGVLVTRHDFNRFSVALSPEVPYGLTRECDDTRPKAQAQRTALQTAT